MNRETEPKPREKPFVRFIFLRHHQFPEDPTHLLHLLSDVDVLFIEAVSLYETPEKRATGEKSLQLCLAYPNTLDEYAQREQDETIAKLEERPNFVNDLIVRLAKSGRQLFYVDIDTQHRAHDHIEIIKDETALLQSFVRWGRIEEAHELLRMLCAHHAEWYRIREETVAEQIKTIVPSLQQNGLPVRAAVIQGLIHTQTATLLDSNTFTVESHVEDVPVPLKYQIQKKLRMGEVVEDHEYDQLLLINYIFFETIPVAPSQQDLLLSYFTNLICSLKNEDAIKLVAQFKLFYRQAKERLTRTKGRLHEEDIKIYSQSLFHEAARKTLQMAQYWSGE